MKNGGKKACSGKEKLPGAKTAKLKSHATNNSITYSKQASNSLQRYAIGVDQLYLVVEIFDTSREALSGYQHKIVRS